MLCCIPNAYVNITQKYSYITIGIRFIIKMTVTLTECNVRNPVFQAWLAMKNMINFNMGKGNESSYINKSMVFIKRVLENFSFFCIRG